MEQVDRKQQEADFHNIREQDRLHLDTEDYQKKYSNKKYYTIVRKSREFTSRWLADHCKGKVALDYCCGLGQVSIEMAEKGAFVHGIDISEDSINSARERAAEAGFADRSSFQVMDAENMVFEDDFFDVIVCSGVLHHLDLPNAYKELSRVLKPGGKILCGEPLGYNPIIALYRKRTPHLRTEWEAEHTLMMDDITKLPRQFGFEPVKVHLFHLFSIAAVVLRRTPFFSPVLSIFELIDAVVLKIPFVNLLAWQVFFELSLPPGDK